MNINTKEHWDKVWLSEGANTWRRYPGCYDRIVDRIGPGQSVLDVGGGVGILSWYLKQAGCYPYIVDISPAAVMIAKTVRGIDGHVQQVPPLEVMMPYDWLVATEFLEHLGDPEKFLRDAVKVAPKAVYAVPNNVLGPDDEPEHMQKFTKKSLVALLGKYYGSVEVDKFVDDFLTGRVGKRGDQLTAENITIPTLLAYCEV